MSGEGAIMSDGGTEKRRLQEPGSFRPDAISRGTGPILHQVPGGSVLERGMSHGTADRLVRQ